MPPDAPIVEPLAEQAPVRPDRQDIIAFITDAESEAVLRDGLSEAAPKGIEGHRGGIRAAIDLLQKVPTPRTLVIDISGEDRPLTALEALSNVVEPDARVLLVGEANDVNFYRHATRVLGVMEYLAKPLTRDLVARHFSPLILNRAPRADSVQGGRMVTVTGVRGGVGTSTIAVHLAWHFATHANRHTVLLDSDLHRGTCALMLNAHAGPGLRMALETPQRIDGLFVERAAQPVTERLHVLAGEESLAEQPGYEPGAVARLIDTVRRRYNFVVVDLPFTGLPLHRDLLMLGHQRVLVMDPTLAGIRDMLRLLALPNGPLHAHRGLVVLNHAGRTGGLSRQQVEDALKMAVDVVLPDLPKQLGNAATMGVPLARRGSFHKGILALSTQVGGTRAAEGAGGRGADRSVWSRMWRFSP